MRKTFRFLAFAVVASMATFTACEPDDETGNNNGNEVVDDNNGNQNPGDGGQTSSITCDFGGVASWNPQSMYGGYEDYDGETFISIVATREQTSFEEIFNFFNEEGIDGENLPEDWVMIGFMANEGTRNVEGSMLMEDTPYGILLLTGDTTIMGYSLPTGWTSTELTITVTNFDMANKKVSANITATMNDCMYVLTDGMMGNPEEKTFTIAINNLSIFDWYENDFKKLAKLLKK